MATSFPQIIYVYHIMGSLFVAERIEDVPHANAIVATYKLDSLGEFRREVKFEKIEGEQNVTQNLEG